MTAVSEAPAIICPPWCVVTPEKHVAELSDLDDTVVHWSSDRPAGTNCRIRIASTTFPDGTQDPTDPIQLFIEDDYFHDGAALDAAQTFAESILAALEEARG